MVPTPVERSDALGVWVKRDDRTSDVYGGNKVRKLEYFLGAARAAGAKRLVTLGAVGSHQVVATAIFGRAHGFEVEAVLVPQPDGTHGRDNLRVALAHGLVGIAAPAWAVAPLYVAARLRQEGTFYIPLGGSSALGTLGFVEAGRELAAQVARGEMPEPDVVVVALGSGGTAAGLAVGFEEAEMRTRVVGVAIAQPAFLLAAAARRLARKTAALAGLGAALGARAAARIDVTGEWVGRGYGHPTPAGAAATELASRAGLGLDATYTAKALAYALARAGDAPAETILYWHTLSSAPLRPAPLAGDAALPPELARLFAR